MFAGGVVSSWNNEGFGEYYNIMYVWIGVNEYHIYIDMWKFRRINRLSFEPVNTLISLKGVEKVDVMEYLNIKKAAPVSDKKGE